MRAQRVLLLTIATWTALSVSPAPAFADGGCADGVRAAFQKVTGPIRRVQDAIKRFMTKDGRAQAKKVAEIRDQKFNEWLAEPKGEGAKHPTWSQFVEDWEKEVTDRMTDEGSKNYPKVEELLALMSERSPTFARALGEFLENKGSVRFKVLAHFMEKIQTLEKGPGEIGGKVTWGSRFWELWRTKIRLPARKAWTADDFSLFMTEMSNAVFRSMNPEPGFRMTWLKAFGEVRLDPKTWKVWEGFANRFLELYRNRYKSFMEGVTLEAYGKVRPEVIRDFYRFGMWNAVMRRLAVFKVALSKEAGGKAIIEGTGLKPEEIDALMNDSPLYSNLPRAVKNALIIKNNPELYRNLLYSAEVDQLSLEVMFFIRPVISGLFLYYTMIEPGYGAYEWNEERKKFEADVKKNPDKYKPNTKLADDDRTKNFKDQLNQLTIEKKQLESELAKNPPLSDGELALRRKALAKIEKRMNGINELMANAQKGSDPPK
ncbi:MAG: hypothetical protein HY075_01940 [Deltaproteobacteria bacterium]|nr:hypothetical protein [Deltaproteobacteria bacterium]